MATPICTNDTVLPDLNQLQIPPNVPYFVLAGENATEILTECCAPNPVKISLGCYQWCEVPESKLNGTVTDSDLVVQLNMCASGYGGRAIYGAGLSSSTVGKNGPSTLGVVTVFLVAGAMLSAA
jgi:hypothetical protein